MNSLKPKPTATIGTPLRSKPPTAPHQFKPSAAQLKDAGSASSVKRPAAPPVYRPQAPAQAVQPRRSNGAVIRKSSTAPPIQAAPKVLPTRVETDRIVGKASAFRGAVQPKLARVIQLKKCPLCGKNGHGKQSCYLNSNTKANPKSGAKQESKAQRAYNAFQGYRSDFFAQNDIDVSHVRAYLNAGHKLHGHGSGGSGSGENQATKDDADAFVGWWRGRLG
jgi:hypothetical protein